MNYIYYKLQHKEEQDVELICCIDLDTIDDDEPTVEYLGNDGVWNVQRPMFCKIDGVSYDFELEELKKIETLEWSYISQALVDCEDSVDEVFIKEFDKAKLYISYDEDILLSCLWK